MNKNKTFLHLPYWPIPHRWYFWQCFAIFRHSVPLSCVVTSAFYSSKFCALPQKMHTTRTSPPCLCRRLILCLVCVWAEFLKKLVDEYSWNSVKGSYFVQRTINYFWVIWIGIRNFFHRRLLARLASESRSKESNIVASISLCTMQYPKWGMFMVT